MKTTIRRSLAPALLAGAAALAHAGETAVPPQAMGQGRTPCAEFTKLVDGDWSHPLNALNFHGYVSWAQGYLSAHPSRAGAAGAPTTDEVKLWLADYCRDHADTSFQGAVEAYATSAAP